MKKLLVLSISSILLTACGGGGGGASNSTSSGNQNNNGSTPNIAQPNKQATSIIAKIVGTGEFVWEEQGSLALNVFDNNNQVVKIKSCVSDNAERLTVSNDCSHVTVHRLGTSTITLTGENNLTTKVSIVGTPARLPFSQASSHSGKYTQDYVTETGEVKVWGYTGSHLPISVLTSSSNNNGYSRYPQKIIIKNGSALKDIYQIATGSLAVDVPSYAINNQGQVYIWGHSANKELTGLAFGGATDYDKYLPRLVKTNQTQSTNLSGIVNLTMNEKGMAIAINDKGHAVEIRKNIVSSGTFSDADYPTEITTLKDLRQVAVNNDNAYAIDKNGMLYTWGINRFKNNFNKLSKVLDANNQPINNAKKILTVSSNNYLLTTDGKVYVWGGDINTFGDIALTERTPEAQKKLQALGGDFAQATVLPNAVKINGVALSDIQDISSTGDAVFALTKNGKIYAWGSNSHGKLGIGIEENVKREIFEPTFVLNETGSAPLDNIVAIHSSSDNGYAVKKDGSVVGWGLNTGTLANKSILTQENDTQVYYKLPVNIYQFKGQVLKLDVSKYTRLY